MVEMGILAGDYLIIERQDSGWWPQPEDLVVTKYLPYNPKRSVEYEPNPNEYVGPVVKVYHRRFGERGCVLGWTKINDLNPYLINADELMPIGKVVGVYRDYRTSIKKTPTLRNL